MHTIDFPMHFGGFPVNFPFQFLGILELFNLHGQKMQVVNLISLKLQGFGIAVYCAQNVKATSGRYAKTGLTLFLEGARQHSPS